MIDPSGMKLLKSIEQVFHLSGLQDFPSFQVIEIKTVEKLRQHLQKSHVLLPACICPAILACRLSSGSFDVHAMVATGIESKMINGKQEDFVQCKNSYRDDTSVPGHGFLTRRSIIYKYHIIMSQNSMSY